MNHIVLTPEEIPVGLYFKIIRTKFDPNAPIEIDGEYTIVEPETNDDTAQENTESISADSANDGASVSS